MAPGARRRRYKRPLPPAPGRAAGCVRTIAHGSARRVPQTEGGYDRGRVPIRAEQQHARMPIACDARQHEQRGPIRPVQIVEHDEQRHAASTSRRKLLTASNRRNCSPPTPPREGQGGSGRARVAPGKMRCRSTAYGSYSGGAPRRASARGRHARPAPRGSTAARPRLVGAARAASPAHARIGLELQRGSRLTDPRLADEHHTGCVPHGVGGPQRGEQALGVRAVRLPGAGSDGRRRRL